MGDVLFGTTLVAAFFGGVVALLAPCCVSVMLPAYFATGFSRRGGVLAATVVFSAGVATVILPIGLGAAAVSRLLAGHHGLVFGTGGILMLASGLAVLAGWKPRLPMPTGRSPAGGGYGSAYLLGVFSGAASACCAPVLAGVALLSGSTASFGGALAIGLTYVTGMVAPLAVLALFWERRNWGTSRLLAQRTIGYRIGPLRCSLPVGMALSGLLLVGMGVLAIVSALAGPGMADTGWQAGMAADLDHAATVATDALAWLPGWVFALLLAAAAVAVLRRARTRPPAATPERTDTSHTPQNAPAEEAIVDQ